ncbi:tetratricopeptide repeat protein [Plantactinospora sp. B5E13]|uniref:tetratricopeptide repeat protein n=1 Tax=Plantactinospora sp. B5E13 TaxID=3153758 RepID=UPI00325F2283
MSQPPQLAAVQDRARAQHGAGDLAGARRLLGQALDAARPAYGNDHPEVLSTALLLAQWHRQADDPAAARRTLEEALTDGQHRWGDADPLMLALSFELGAVAEELGNRHEARRNFTRIATIGPGVLGVDHWQVRAARDYLGEPPSTGASPEMPSSGLPSAPPPPVQPAAVPPAPVAQPGPVAPPQPISAPHAPNPVSAPHAPNPVSAPVGMPVSSSPASAAPYPSSGAGFPTSGTPYPSTGSPAVRATGPGYEPATYPPYSAQSAAQPETYPVVTMPAPTPVAEPAPRSSGRGSTVAAAVAAAAAVIAAIVVVVAVVADKDAPPPPTTQDDPGGVVISGEPPTEVKLLDEGTAITITWADPSGGTVPFLVTGAQRNKEAQAMGRVSAGDPTSFTVNALNPRLEYCFTVLAVYSTSEFAPSDLVCTTRGTGASPN